MAASKRKSSSGKAKPAPPPPSSVPSTAAAASRGDVSSTSDDNDDTRARSRTVALLGLACSVVALFPIVHVRDRGIERAVAVSALVSLAGFFATKALIPLVAARTLRAGLFGMDINKKGTPGGNRKIPEAAGLAVGAVFLVCLALFQHLHASGGVALLAPSAASSPPPPLPATSFFFRGSGSKSSSTPTTTTTASASDAWLVDYNAALAAIAFMLLLGFADDVLDVPWRVKLVLPAFAALPLLVAYNGGTGISLPHPLFRLLQGKALPFNIYEFRSQFIELGWIYKAYMAALVIFCTNAINILAGVNGLEAGQTAVTAAAVAAHNLSSIASLAAAAVAGDARASASADGHLFSLFIMLPLLATSLGLLWHNWYPSDVFVGDTYTYFAGMALAVAGILGHFSETLLVFLVPQVVNFAYSLPQLLKIVPCPRHRLPTFDPSTGLLTATNNWNLVNAALAVFGPTTERGLCVRLLGMQAACCALGFGARYALAGVYKG